MDSAAQRKIELRRKRRMRVRQKLRGTAEKPRLCVVKTNQHIHLQLIDDVKGCTLVSASTCAKEMKQTEHNRKSKEAGKILGEKLAQLALAKQVKKVVFDRGAHRYHGILLAIADGAREAGLEF